MKEQRSEKIRKIILVIAIVVFLFSSVTLVLKNYRNKETAAKYQQVQEEAVVLRPRKGEESKAETQIDTGDVLNPQDSDGESGGSYVQAEENTVAEHWYDMAEVNFEYLQSINPDIRGWLFFENEDISYPILQGRDNNTYLRTTFLKEPATAGSIFMESTNRPDFSDAHIIIYGHNMKNETMFGKLKYYRLEKDYYSTHQYFQVLLPGRACRYRIFAYKEVEADDPVYQIAREYSAEFRAFVSQYIENENYLKTGMEKEGVIIDENAQIITLSTCSRSEKRFIISGVKIEEKVY